MITFVTLFIGLTVGTQSVRLAATPAVASIDLLLDGEEVGHLGAPPWATRLDFGPLATHELEAVARSDDGREIGRARQLVNVPRALTEATLLVELGSPPTATLAWESVADAEPEAWTVELDGRPLAVPRPDRFTLPPLDPAELHHLRVELEFQGGLDGSADAIFGGTFGERIDTELTAVLVSDARELATSDRLTASVRGTPTRFVGLETGPATVYFVVAPGARTALAATEGRTFRTRPPVGRHRPQSHDDWLAALAVFGPDERVQIVWPSARPRQGHETTFDVFARSAVLEARRTGFAWLLLREADGPPLAEAPRLADAVAVAGVAAARDRRRRAVVLYLDDPAPRDASHLAVGQVIRYLEQIQVPLVVWSAEGGSGPWGEAIEVATVTHLDREVGRLREGLARQRIALVAGRFIPSQVQIDRR